MTLLSFDSTRELACYFSWLKLCSLFVCLVCFLWSNIYILFSFDQPPIMEGVLALVYNYPLSAMDLSYLIKESLHACIYKHSGDPSLWLQLSKLFLSPFYSLALSGKFLSLWNSNLLFHITFNSYGSKCGWFPVNKMMTTFCIYAYLFSFYGLHKYCVVSFVFSLIDT